MLHKQYKAAYISSAVDCDKSAEHSSVLFPFLLLF